MFNPKKKEYAHHISLVIMQIIMTNSNSPNVTACQSGCLIKHMKMTNLVIVQKYIIC